MAGQVPQAGDKRRSIIYEDPDTSSTASSPKRQARQYPANIQTNIQTIPQAPVSNYVPHTPTVSTPIYPFQRFGANQLFGNPGLLSTPSSTTEYSWSSSPGESSAESTPLVNEFDARSNSRTWTFQNSPLPASNFSYPLVPGPSSQLSFLFPMQNPPRQVPQQRDNCQWDQFLNPGNLQYDTSIACTNPTCDDGVPCQDTSAWCGSDVCVDESCEAEACYDDHCAQQSRCGSPCQDQGDLCYDEHCNVPSCEALSSPFQQSVCWDQSCQTGQQCSLPCPDPLPPAAPMNSSSEAHRNLYHITRDPIFECIDPNCLIRSNAPIPGSAHAHAHSHLHPPNHGSFLANLSTRTSSYDPIASSEQDFPASDEELSMDKADMKGLGFLEDPMEEDMDQEISECRCQWVQHTKEKGGNGIPCGLVFSSPEKLHHHVEKSHIEGLPREEQDCHGFYCHWLGCDRFMCRSFQARPKLKRHMQTHTLYKPFVCTMCGVQMKTKDAMEKHERTHSGERPYVCKNPGCDKVFATSTELKTHTVVHSGLKPHKCPICHECFADSSNLSKHKKTHFLGMYKCPECGARMKRWDQMRRHIVTQKHSQELLNNKQLQQEYKARMEKEFKEMPEEERALEVPDRTSDVSN